MNWIEVGTDQFAILSENRDCHVPLKDGDFAIIRVDQRTDHVAGPRFRVAFDCRNDHANAEPANAAAAALVRQIMAQELR